MGSPRPADHSISRPSKTREAYVLSILNLPCVERMLSLLISTWDDPASVSDQGPGCLHSWRPRSPGIYV